MKKILSALLCCCLIFTAAGCVKHTSVPGATAAPTFPATQAATQTPTQPVAAGQPLTALTLQPTRETAQSETGTDLFYFDSQVVYLLTQDAAVTEMVTLDLMRRIDHVRSASESIADAAAASYTPDAEGWTPFLSQITYTPARIDPGVLSLLGEEVTFTGGIHPNSLNTAVNYDLLTGRVLTVYDILTEEATTEQLFQLLLSALEAQADSLYPDYADIAWNRFAEGAAADDGWYFSETGLCFFFSPYEIAPYSSGQVSAEIPYHQLVGILREEYFPAEQLGYDGTMQAAAFTDAGAARFSQFAEVILNRDAPQALLYTDGAVSNIRMESGAFSADGTTFTPSGTVFAASALSSGQAVTVQADLAASPLRLTYCRGEEIVSRILTLENDAPILK